MPALMPRRLPRIQEVVLPILRDGFQPVRPDIEIGSWVDEVSRRDFPLINVRRLGGITTTPEDLAFPVIELTAYSNNKDSDYKGYPGTEQLLLDADYLIYQAVQNQTVVPGVGYLHSYFQTMGPMQFDSPYEDTWRVQMLIQLGLRPTRQ
jgi:hypothetical protein